MKQLYALQERAKELNCLYRIHQVLACRDLPPLEVFTRVLERLPEGWQHPEATGARIEYLGRTYAGPGFGYGERTLYEPLRVGGVAVGFVEVSTTHAGEPDFLREEVELLRTVAARISEYLEWKHLDLVYQKASTRVGDHWRWRQAYAESLASTLDPDRFGVSALYLGGSTESGEAGPGSDIDLYVVCHGSAAQRKELALWLEGWSLCLGQLALQQTGKRFPTGLLNVHWLERPPSAPRVDLRELPLQRTRVA